MSTDSEQRLSDLFVEVTGEESVTEEQAESPSHDVVEESALDADAVADGLADAVDEAFSETDVGD
jgi:hypothetical protein